MSGAYRVVVENDGTELCPWCYWVWNPSGEKIDSSRVFSKEYAERCARAAIQRDKQRKSSRYGFEVAA